jgi:mannose-6-phosphate isomerase-like protein (cupin superfamily)
MARTRLVIRVDTGTTITKLLDDSDGCHGLHQRKMSLAPGAVVTGIAAGSGESWYVRSGTVRLAPGGSLAPDTAVWLPPGTTYQVQAGTPAEILATTIRADTGAAASAPRKIVALADCPVERTGDRKFRVLLSSGLTFTQFVGEIPPGRAPAHHHTYDEVVHVLSGHGVIHRDGTEAPIGPGTSIYLSPYTEHCLENTGTDVLRVLGVFHPAGSPAVKYPAS